MSAQPKFDIDDREPVDHPSRSDAFVRGLSQAIGGPIGEHAVGYDRPRAAWSGRFWTAARIVLALTCLTLALHWVQKSPCRTGAWADYVQYKQFCYTDVLALYYAEGLNEGKVPYFDHPVEYPVLTGAFMGVLGLPVHKYGADHPGFNQGMWFYNLNALVLGALALATTGVILSLRRRRPWDAAMFALAPALFVTATVNWDFLAIGLAAFGIYAWARRWPIVAGILLGLGGAAKLWPLFLFGPLVVLALRTGRMRQILLTAASVVAGALAWLIVNVPIMIMAPTGWQRFFELSRTRGIDWGTLWYVGAHFPRGRGQYGLAFFTSLGNRIPTLNNLTYVLFALGCLGIALVAFTAPRRPRFGQLAFLVVAVFLLTSKVWSQQFVLWLIPLAVLARPRWGAFLAWQFAEICYFVAFYGELLGASNKSVFPEGVFVLASSLRLITVAVLCGFVVRDIMRPEQDVVRRTYEDDPDGGIFDGVPDPEWLRRKREPTPPRDEPALVG